MLTPVTGVALGLSGLCAMPFGVGGWLLELGCLPLGGLPRNWGFLGGP